MKDIAAAEIVLDAPVSEVPRVSFAKESLVKQLFGGLVGSSSPRTGSYDNLGEVSIWVLNHILEFCEKMGLEVEGKETELFDFCLISWLLQKQLGRKQHQGLMTRRKREKVGEDSASWGITLKLYPGL